MGENVITRIWHGVTKSEHADEYLQYVMETGVAGYKSTGGNLGVEILRRIESDKCHFWTVTYLKLSKKKLGSLINFNVALLKNGIKRMIN